MKRWSQCVLALVLVLGVSDAIRLIAAEAQRLQGQAHDFLGHHLGEGPATDPGSRRLHASVYEDLGEIAAVNPLLAGVAPAVLLAGVENELVAGVAERLGSRPFLGTKGFDWLDLEANAHGLGRGLSRGFVRPFDGSGLLGCSVGLLETL